MYTVILSEPHKLGLEKLTGSNRGLFYANERKMEIPSPESSDSHTDDMQTPVEMYQYDVYEVEDARFPDAVKDDVVTQQYPRDEEHKILRKTLSALLLELGLLDDPRFSEFKAYHEFVESIKGKR